MDEFALDDEGAGADDGGGGVGDAEEEVGVVARGHPCVALVPLLFCDLVSDWGSQWCWITYEAESRDGVFLYLFSYISNGSEYAQNIQEAVVEVIALDWAALVAFGQLREDLGRDEL
jgi:hypothetical protein